MQFASLSFLFLFLPITLSIYHLTPQRWKREVMLGISILFLLSGGLAAAGIELLLTIGTFFAGWLLEHLQKRRKLGCLFLGGVVLLYAVMLLLLRSDWMQVWETALVRGSDFFPLGLAFFALQGIGYCADVRRGKCSAERNWRTFFIYMLFYPRLIMGPVVSYTAAEKSCLEISSRKMQQIGAGLSRFTLGLAKKLILADWVGMFFTTMEQAGISEYSAFSAWLGALSHWLSLYLELSGYADMAIGLAQCYGVQLPGSYGNQLFYPSISRFSENWNRSVVQWFSHYVGTHFHGKKRLFHLFAVLITWGLVGLWYGFRWPSVLWGWMIGLFLDIEYLMGRKIRHYGLRYAVTTVILCVGSLLLTMPDLSSVWEYFRIMIGTGRVMPVDRDLNLIRSYGLAMILSIYAATGNWRSLLHMVENKLWFRRIRIPLTVCICVLFFMGCVILLIGTNGSSSVQLML